MTIDKASVMLLVTLEPSGDIRQRKGGTQKFHAIEFTHSYCIR